MNLSDIVADYSCIVSGISKSEVMKVMQKIDLTEKDKALWNIKNYYYI